MRARTWAGLLAVTALVAVAGPGAAQAQDPGRWVETGHDLVPLEYFQGLTSDNHRNIYFDGLFSGLYRTDLALTEEARNISAIPNDVFERERYNHIGDITWDRREGGRVLLPLECFIPFLGNPCKTGSIGVADPETLQFRYYVKLDPAFIDKAMWAETSPDGKLLWTSNGALNGGRDLLAYSMKEIKAANAAPGGPLLKPVRVLANAVPPSGITGAVFYKKRLFLAGQGGGPFRVWSVDLRDGSRRLEIEKNIFGESEGLDIVKARGGKLHWLITPLIGSGSSYGNTSALVHFNPVKQPNVRCGDVITRSVRLDADVICPDGTPAAVTIAADHVTLDLAGHSIVNGRTDEGETVAVTTTGPVEDLEIRNGTIRAGDKAVDVVAGRSELEDLTIDGHVRALHVAGDRNEFDDLTVTSSFHAIQLEGGDLEFEDSDVSVHRNEQLGGITGDHNEIEGSSFRECGSSGLSVSGNDVAVERNVLFNCTLLVVGSGSKIDRNSSTRAAGAGIAVQDPSAVVTRNDASDNSDSGIALREPGAHVARNTANGNGEWGIEAALGTVDGGGNRASGNGQAAQCLNVVCSP
ncbi:MAG TPA: right-handed parallel beta-helix repeat-containing protein [Solirubrobacterales bacterium]|nr:right-handed parallel beta-helix repeat-containing protein [Solirubrobacterales bacterium]